MRTSCFLRGLLLCGFLLSFSLEGMCQRQTSGRPSFDGYVNFGFGNGTPFRIAGGGVSWCNYDFMGRTALGLDVFTEPLYYTEPAVITNGEVVAPEIPWSFMATDICGSVGYMFRLLSPRNRSVILSAGAHLLLGAKYCPEMAGFKKSGEKNYSQVGFFLGLVPDVQLEVFPFRNVSLYAGFRPRARLVSGIGGSDKWLTLSATAGFKVYL